MKKKELLQFFYLYLKWEKKQKMHKKPTKYDELMIMTHDETVPPESTMTL